MDIRNKKVTVVGLGNSGIGCAALLYKAGAVVSVTEAKDDKNVRKAKSSLEKKYIDLEIGKHTDKFLEDTELLVVSPGVEDMSGPVRYAEKNNIPIISELELGYLFCRAPVVAVTGTNGKSTVVSLVGEILRSAGRSVNVCGNIGNSLSGEVAAGRNTGKKSVVVLEVSSFQLERIASFRPKISVILNIAPDHLDRYKSFKEYTGAKTKIFQNQKKDDFVILNHDDKYLRRLGRSGKIKAKVLYFSAKSKVKGIYIEKKAVKTFLKNKVKYLFKLEGSRLEGGHNVENILASTLVAVLLKADLAVTEKTIKSFKPLAHRFRRIATIGGVEFIDDSKATNIDSTNRALLSLKKPAILIAGGKDKNLSYKDILPAAKKAVKKIILIGETRKKMRRIFEGSALVEEKDTLPAAVAAAYKSATAGECVLLSPMCSSFDMFESYKQRGAVFRQAVQELKLKVKNQKPKINDAVQ